MSGRPEPERSDWSEEDLLTRGEAAGRVRAEIERVRSRPAAGPRPQERAALERRPHALETWTRSEES